MCMKEQPDPPERLEASSAYSLSVEEASGLFASAGVARSPRTIIRYCARGHLDCIKADTEQNEKYLITRESVDRRIEEIRQVAKSSHVSTRRDESRHDAPRRDTVESRVDNSSPELGKKVKDLEAEVFDLKITNRGKDYFLKQLQDERKDLMDQVRVQSRTIGQLEARLQLRPGQEPPQLPGAAGSELSDSPLGLPESLEDEATSSSSPAEPAGPAPAPSDTEEPDGLGENREVAAA